MSRNLYRTYAPPGYRCRISHSACLAPITRLPFLEVAQALACDRSFYILKTFELPDRCSVAFLPDRGRPAPSLGAERGSLFAAPSEARD
jgi:hypothetical protein